MRWLRAYRLLNRDVLLMVVGTLLVNLINSGFFLIFNLYLRNLGYPDPEIGQLVSLRYAGVLAVSLPIGIYIRRRRLKPLFVVSAGLLPLLSLALIECVRHPWPVLTQVLMFLWGCCFVATKVCAIPFILRHTRKGLQAEAISLNYATWSFSVIIASTLIALLAPMVDDWLPSDWMSNGAERPLLYLVSLLGFGAVWAFAAMREKSVGTDATARLNWRADYDWRLIIHALIPTMFLAVGAGLTIPFLNLYFNQVFGFSSAEFSQLGLASAVLVFGSVLIIPAVQKRFGYGMVVTVIQSIAVLLLFALASTQLYASEPYAPIIAIIALLGRDPLMNAAAPMTNELMMNYVGKRNQEMVSALLSSIWSGGWFASGILFKWMRGAEMPYWQVFCVTGMLYTGGVIAYHLLIQAYSRKEAQAKTA